MVLDSTNRKKLITINIVQVEAKFVGERPLFAYVLRHPIRRDECYNSRNRDTLQLRNGDGKRNRVEMTGEVASRETSRNNRRCGFALTSIISAIHQQFRHLPSSSSSICP